MALTNTFRSRSARTGPVRARYVALTAGAVVLALGATACSGSKSSGSDSATSAAPASSTAPTTGAPAPATAAQTHFTSYTSTKSFDDTVSSLKKAAASAGMMILGDMNQAGALKSTGLNLNGAHTFFVGNPVKGKMFFQTDQAIGAVIPLRIYAWADDQGTAHVGYFDPAALFTAVDPKLTDGGKQMAMAAAKIAEGATGGSATAGTEAAADFTTVTSTKSFDDTISALKKTISANGMMSLGSLNQAGALKSTGLNLKGAQTFFVGNPVKGKMFFQTDPAIGAVVPLTMYVWADDQGTAHVGYFDPAALFTAVDPKLTDGGKQMSMAASKIAEGAAK